MKGAMQKIAELFCFVIHIVIYYKIVDLFDMQSMICVSPI